MSDENGNSKSESKEQEDKNYKINVVHENPKLLDDEWMIKPCELYDEEYSDCTSIKARFHQYFVFGKTSDCKHWKEASFNCYRWRDKKDLKARVKLSLTIERKKQKVKESFENWLSFVSRLN